MSALHSTTTSPTDLSPLITAALGPTTRVAEDAGAGASAVSTTLREIKFRDIIDTREIATFIFAMEQLVSPIDPKAEDDCDTADEKLPTRLPVEIIQKILYQHAYDFDPTTESQAMLRIRAMLGPEMFNVGYTNDPPTAFKRIQYDYGQKPSEVITTTTIADTRWSYYIFSQQEQNKKLELKNFHLHLHFLPPNMHRAKYRTIQIQNCNNLRRLPEEWLGLESYLPGRGLRQFEVTNCPKLILSPKMQAMMERIAYRQKCYLRLGIACGIIFSLSCIACLAFLASSRPPKTNESS